MERWDFLHRRQSDATHDKMGRVSIHFEGCGNSNLFQHYFAVWVGTSSFGIFRYILETVDNEGKSVLWDEPSGLLPVPFYVLSLFGCTILELIIEDLQDLGNGSPGFCEEPDDISMRWVADNNFTATETCAICLINDGNCVTIPCRHEGVCDTCFRVALRTPGLNVKKCSFCRREVETIIRTNYVDEMQSAVRGIALGNWRLSTLCKKLQ